MKIEQLAPARAFNGLKPEHGLVPEQCFRIAAFERPDQDLSYDAPGIPSNGIPAGLAAFIRRPCLPRRFEERIHGVQALAEGPAREISLARSTLTWVSPQIVRGSCRRRRQSQPGDRPARVAGTVLWTNRKPVAASLLNLDPQDINAGVHSPAGPLFSSAGQLTITSSGCAPPACVNTRKGLPSGATVSDCPPPARRRRTSATPWPSASHQPDRTAPGRPGSRVEPADAPARNP